MSLLIGVGDPINRDLVLEIGVGAPISRDGRYHDDIQDDLLDSGHCFR